MANNILQVFILCVIFLLILIYIFKRENTTKSENYSQFL